MPPSTSFWRSLHDPRTVLTLCAVVAALGFLCVVAELSLALFGWAVLCLLVGALFALAAFYAVVGCVVAAVVCVVPWAALRLDALAPERFALAALDACLWLARAFAGVAWRALGSLVHPEVTPAVVTGAALVAAAGAVALAARIASPRSRP